MANASDSDGKNKRSRKAVVPPVTTNERPDGQSASGASNGAFRRDASRPSPDAVRRRAYQIFEERGRQHGRDHDDWLQAEQELRNKAS